MSAALLLTSAVLAASPSGWVASVNATSLLSRGLEVQVERYFGGDEWSALGAAGVRWSASMDFGGYQLGAGAELRRWLWRGGPGSSAHQTRLGGLFASARLEAGRSEVWRAAEPTRRATMLQLQPSLHLGYRFILFDHLELTPSFGPALSILSVAGASSAPLVRPDVEFGLSAGALF